MKIILTVFCGLAFMHDVFSTTVFAEEPSHSSAAIEGLSNGKWISPTVAVGGVPSQKSLKALSNSGVQVVVNFQTTAEIKFDEKRKVEDLGMTYLHLPVSSLEDFTDEMLGQVKAALGPATNPRKALVHCASSNRVGAAFSLMSQRFDGATVSEALAIGRQHGMTSLESQVEALLKVRSQ
jgi:protein tyrosine phosphatase (PTP) superfamily phosphohydrolase (DUF442 family)